MGINKIRMCKTNNLRTNVSKMINLKKCIIYIDIYYGEHTISTGQDGTRNSTTDIVKQFK